MHVDDALTERRDALVNEVRAGLQDECTDLHLGIFIASININVTWPPIVDPAFSAVPNAKQEKAQRVEKAKADAAAQIARATGDASGLLAEANGYKKSVVDGAEGEKARFDVIRSQYESAGIITTQSLYSDAMSTILKDVGRIYVVQPGQRMQLFLQPDDKTPTAAPGPPRP
jgi:membrane protease subunit HflK